MIIFRQKNNVKVFGFVIFIIRLNFESIWK